MGTFSGGMDVVAAELAVVGAGGVTGTAGFAGAAFGGASGLKEGSELSMESLRSAYPLICPCVSYEDFTAKKTVFT